ncbi:MAG: hypothetical protein K8R69_01075 [Deltaproteobacteria bacterium]|nr:hypothetical protein [Deltaproteobacteria bacterium]
MSRSLQSAAEHGKEPLEDLQQNATQVADDMLKLGNAIQSLAADSWQSVQNKLSELYDSGQHKVASAEKKIEGQIQKRPMQALLVAAGVGFLIGLMKRK